MRTRVANPKSIPASDTNFLPTDFDATAMALIERVEALAAGSSGRLQRPAW